MGGDGVLFPLSFDATNVLNQIRHLVVTLLAKDRAPGLVYEGSRVAPASPALWG